VALPPTVPHKFPVTDTPRFRRIAEEFGMLAHEQGLCGCHVHVGVPDREIAIQVGNFLHSWLPLFLALTANSAIYRSAETGFASWRNILWRRWPSAGPRSAGRSASGSRGSSPDTTSSPHPAKNPVRTVSLPMAALLGE
jgi:carboxylate-amine ligase